MSEHKGIDLSKEFEDMYNLIWEVKDKEMCFKLDMQLDIIREEI